ncbi:MAG: hypothetical protein DWP95_03875 [Proteobacteria bacterium]|nr:MAG: hypothetical protein DWP95_03875 [Pseudomonadota bacterium]
MLLTFVSLWMLTGCQSDEGVDKETQITETTEHFYVKSVHYFSSAWPKTFWQNFEKPDVPKELQQIKNDGFNTVVLTVPWRGFEKNFSADKTTSVDAMYQRLDFMLQEITALDLHFMLRLGFPHDFNPDVDASILQLCQGMYTEEKTRQQWLDYLNNIKNIVTSYQSYSAGMMISWEDFWCPHFVFTELSQQERLQLAQTMGYSEWLRSSDKNQHAIKTLLGQNEISSANTAIPKKNEQSYVLYLDFIDHALHDILLLTRTVFPNTSLEIRVDKDPVKVNDKLIWVGHDLYLEDSHRATYWAPFWGAKNQGELLTADEAVEKFDYFLNYVTGDGINNNHVIEQFNFTDNTPYFPNNANIKPDEVNNFLVKAAPLLKQKSSGYGLWAYRDYADNLFYNAYFEQGLHGWQHNEQVGIQAINGDNHVHIKAGGFIEQSMIISDRVMWAVSYENMSFCYQGHKAGEVVITVNDEQVVQLKTETGRQCHLMPAELFKKHLKGKIRIQALNDVIMDEVKIYGFIQELGVYDHFGQPGPYLEGVRQLNKEL